MASKPIGSLYAALGLDSSQFDAGVTKAQKRLQSFGDFKFGRGLKGGLDEIDSGMRGLASRAGIAGAALSSAGLAGVAAAAGFVAVAGAMAKAREALAFADEIGDTANKLAVTTDALQEYRYAVHQLGGEYQDADAALEGFSKAFGAAHAQLTKKATKPFEALGLDPKDFDSTEDALQAVIEKISQLKSTAEQAAIADKLGLTAMLPAIRAGVDEMDRLRMAAHNVGYVMDADLISKAGEANDKFEDLQKIVGVQLHSAFADLAPVLLGLGQLAVDIARTVRGIVDSIASIQNKSSEGLDKRANTVSKELLILKRAQANGQGVSQVAIDSKIAELNDIEAERQKRKVATAAPPPKSGTELNAPGGTGGSKGPRDRTADALADVELKELNARMALTENVERLAEMKARQVDIETKKANRDVAQDIAEGTITAAAGKIIVAKNNELADLEKQKIQREAMAELAAQELEHRHAVASEYEKVADLAADEAATTAERNRIEAKALEDRQRLERRDLDNEIEQQLIAEKITESAAAELRAAQADRQAAEKKAQQRKAQLRTIDEETDLATSTLRKQQDQLGALSMVAKSTYARAVIEAKILTLKQQEERLQAEAALKKATPGSAEEQIARDRLEGLKDLHKAEQAVADESTSLAEAIQTATDNVRDFKDAFRRHDWAGLFNSLAATVETIRAAFQSQGLTGGLLSTAGALGQLVGGKAGHALSTGAAAGIGASALGSLGAQLGAWAAPQVGAAALAGTSAGLAGFASSAATILGTIGALAGPIAIVAGLASLFLGSKPSNHAGIAQIDGNTIKAVSSGKETDETQNAANQTAQALLQAEQLLAQAGVTLKTSVSLVDLGTRDKTRIVLSDGTEFRTNAVGDPAEAAETALKRLLQGATYADDALKQLVESALAAGKGFDDIATILQAQQVGKQLADQILQLTDPQAYAKKQVTDDIKAQRDAAKALFDQGSLTADQLAAINDQLDTLEGLKLADVMKQFGGSVSDATQKLQDWLESLTGITASPGQNAAQAYARLQAAGLAARNGDQDALEKIPELGNAYIAAAKAIAGSQQEYLLAVARARAIGSSALLAATNPTGLAPPTAAMSAANSPTATTDASQLVASGSPANDTASSDLAALKSEVVSLREDIRAAANALAANGKAATKILDRWDGEGLPDTRAS